MPGSVALASSLLGEMPSGVGFAAVCCGAAGKLSLFPTVPDDTVGCSVAEICCQVKWRRETSVLLTC